MKNHSMLWKLSNEKIQPFRTGFPIRFCVSVGVGLRASEIPFKEEISDLTDRLDETDRAKESLDREKRETDLENNEVKAALEDAEAAVATEEAKVARLQVEVCQTKTDFEKRLCEKDDEMENMRKNAQPGLQTESIDYSL